VHPFADIWIAYVAFTGALVELFNVSVIVGPDPLAAAFVMPVVTERFQEKLTPDVAVLAVYVPETLLHLACVVALLSTGEGFTVTVTVCDGPWQPVTVDVAATVYVTVCMFDAIFVIVLLSGFADCWIRLSPVVFGLSVPIHEYVEDIFAVRAIEKLVPLHILAVVPLVMVGAGLIVTVIVCGGPVHPWFVDVGTAV
jgi:hypothetical protein